MNDAHWRVVVDDRAHKGLRRLDPPTRQRILSAITRLAHGAELLGDIKRLTGSGEYRLRVGDWRVRFERDDRRRTIVVVRSSRAAAPTTAERSTPLPRRERLRCRASDATPTMSFEMASELNVKVRFEDDRLWATVDEYPGVFATGDDLDELRESLEEAISLYLAEPDEEFRPVSLVGFALRAPGEAPATAVLEYV